LIIDFFNSLDPYKFFAEAPLFLLFFLPGIIAGALLGIIHGALNLVDDGLGDAVAFAGYVVWLFFLGDFAATILHGAGVAKGIPSIAAVLAVLFLNSASIFALVPLIQLMRRVSGRKGEKQECG
jgi:hypothetical protein